MGVLIEIAEVEISLLVLFSSFLILTLYACCIIFDKMC